MLQCPRAPRESSGQLLRPLTARHGARARRGPGAELLAAAPGVKHAGDRTALRMAKPEKFSEPPTEPQIVDSESDSEQDDALTRAGAAGSGTSSETVRRAQVIHSGHFMVSSPHSDPEPRRKRSYYDFDTVNKPRCQTYSFGPFSSGRLSIDPTLTRLFECMTLAYSGKIVSPKWKSFKGLRLLWRDKIRLNNGIWRAWFIQCERF